MMTTPNNHFVKHMYNIRETYNTENYDKKIKLEDKLKMSVPRCVHCSIVTHQNIYDFSKTCIIHMFNDFNDEQTETHRSNIEHFKSQLQSSAGVLDNNDPMICELAVKMFNIPLITLLKYWDNKENIQERYTCITCHKFCGEKLHHKTGLCISCICSNASDRLSEEQLSLVMKIRYSLSRDMSPGDIINAVCKYID